MSLNHLKLCAVLVATLLFFGFSPSLHAGNFKIKPLVLSGDAAPGGGAFSFVGLPRLNQRGDIAFDGRTSSSESVYLVSGGNINLMLSSAVPLSMAGSVVDPTSLGFTLVPSTNCLFSDALSCFRYEITDREGIRREVECLKEVSGPQSSLKPTFLNDSLDFVFSSGPDGFNSDSGTALFSAGSTRWASCPLEAYLRLVLFSDFSSFFGIAPVGLTNAGTIGLTFSTSDGGLAILVVSGGSASITNFTGVSAPGGGTIRALRDVAMNENQTFLVPFLTSDTGGFATDGLFLFRGGSIVPVALKGMDAPGGRKFQAFSGATMNNAEQIVFAALLDDGSQAIFRRAPDGTSTVLQDGITNFFNTALSINEKGDVAAQIFWPFLSEIRFFGATGSPSRVVGSGDPAPGGGTFQRVGSPRLNNEGKIVFWASLSDGRSGIFLASSLEMEFLDPVPDLLSGAAITSSRLFLATEGRPVDGIAADGVSKVLVRVKTAASGRVEFSLVNGVGQGASLLPANNINGSLSSIDGDMVSNTVSVDTEDVTGTGPVAFAVYHAPIDFAGGPASTEATLGDRTVFIKAKLTTSTGETIESTKPLTIIRPPVVLVHGLWSTSETWRFFGGLSPRAPDPRVQVSTVDYSGSDGFALNADVLQIRLRRIISGFKNGLNPLGVSVAAIQADVVTHSMGGNVARTLATTQEFAASENFGKGPVHKFVTIDTPHLGSEFATRLYNSNLICRLIFRLSGYPVEGAVRDLSVGSPALQALNGADSYSLPSHVIVGIANSAQEQSAEENIRSFAFGLGTLICPGLLPLGGFQEIFGGPSDLLVSVTSQAAIGLSLGGLSPGTVSDGIIHSVIPKLFTLGPDSLSRDIMDGQIVGAATPNPPRVIDLLNEAIQGDAFGPIRP